MALVVSTSTAILTLSEAKAHVGETGTSRDAEIQRYVDAATELIEDYVGPVRQRQVTQTVTGYGTVLLKGRVVSLDSVTLNGTAVTGYTVNLAAGLLHPSPSYAGLYGAVVTYTVGFAVIPESIRLAAFYTVRHAYESADGAVVNGGGDEVFTIGRGFALPNRAKEYLAPFRRGPAIA